VPGTIFGHLDATGQGWLINPNGVLFGRGAQVNVGGLLASTPSVNDPLVLPCLSRHSPDSAWRICPVLPESPDIVRSGCR